MLKEMVRENSYVPTITSEHFEDAKRNKMYLNLSVYDQHRIGNWFKYESQFYYLKYIDTLSEFIGEKIADLLDLRTAHYIPVRKDNNILVASQNFKYMDYKYLYANELFRLIPKEELLEDREYESVRENILKMFSLDIYMRQLDRCEANIIFEMNQKGRIALAPVYDYAFSFYTSYYNKYDNAIEDIVLEKQNFYNLTNKYPNLYEYMLRVLNLDIEKILLDICDDFDFELTSETKDFYLGEDETSKKLIKKVL